MQQLVNSIVDNVNKDLEKLLKTLQAKDFTLYHTAEQTIKQGTTNEQYPTVFIDETKQHYVGPNDLKDLVAYHRNNTMQVTNGDTRTGYGDAVARPVLRFGMQLVLWWDAARLHIDKRDLCVYIVDNVVNMKKNDNFVTRLTFGNVILNSSQVFAQEYRNVAYFIRPEHNLIALSYTIENTYTKRGCFNLVQK